MRVQSVHLYHCRSDHHDQSSDEKSVSDVEDMRECSVPSELWVHRPEDPLCEDQVNQVDDQDSGVVEDLCSDGDLDVSLHCGPYDPHDTCDDSCHAEAEEDCAEKEFVISFAILLENCHVGSGKADVEHKEDRGDRDIDSDRWYTTDGCCAWRIWWLARTCQ